MKRLMRNANLRVALMLALVGLGAVTAPAATAAPVHELRTVGDPYSVPVGKSGDLLIVLRNSGDGVMADGSVTVTATLPAGVTATSATGGSFFGSPVYTCSIAGGAQTVTCTGPSTFGAGIGHGYDACQSGNVLFALPTGDPCPIKIKLKVGGDAPVGDLPIEIQSCGGGAGTCGTTIQNLGVHEITGFGAEYGMAPINDHPDAVQDAPAIPEDQAFWAGACDRGAAPGFGADLATVGNGTGFGSRPSTILAPATASDGVATPAPVVMSAPTSPDHCLDWGYGINWDSRSRDRNIWPVYPFLTPTVNAPVDPPPGVAPGVAQVPRWRLPAETRAGSHPDGTSMMIWNRHKGGNGVTPGKIDGNVDNIYVDLPAGFVGDPTAVPYCTNVQFREQPLECPPSSQVGVLRLNIEGLGIGVPQNKPGNWDTTYPVYNLEPRKGNVAELGFAYVGGPAAIRLVAKARTNGDYGVTAFVGQVPAALLLLGQQITLWGVPWAAENDQWRTAYPAFENRPAVCESTDEYMPFAGPEYMPATGLRPACQAPHDPSWGPVKPFLTAQTECAAGSVTTTLRTDSFQGQGAFTADGFPDSSDPDWKTYGSDSPPVTECSKLPFDPAATVDPTSMTADSASGLDVDIAIPQNDDPPADLTAGDAAEYWRSDDGLATSQLDKSVVPLPEGFTINPAAAAGLEGCTDAQMGVTSIGNPHTFNNTEPSCPDGSHIGTAEASTPLLDEKLTGEFILGVPKSTDPASGQMFRVFLVVRNKERGLLAKVHGTSVADPATGRLTATFDKNPRVPVENIKVSLKGGERGLFAQTPTCGEKTSNAVFTPWTAAHGGGGVAKTVSDSFTVGGDCSFGFAPTLAAGMDIQKARGTGAFSFEFTRPQGDQTLKGLTAELPTGLLASVKDLPLCKDAQAAAGNCPAASRIGLVDASAGSGDPFVLEQKGEVFLTEGYKGGPYGLMVKVRAIAGPFRGAMELSPIIVRQKIEVDPTTAQVKAISDPFPTVWHGVPLRVRRVLVNVDRPSFMVNPSDCSSKQVNAQLSSAEGTVANRPVPFQASGCRNLAFKPELALSLTGRKQVTTGKHPGVRAVVTQTGIGEAGIEKAEVRLPKSLALDPDNAQALCEFEAGTKDDLENHCPKGSIVGRARATSPLLNDPLVGNVYFVKNIRIDRKTGNQIRTLPMIIVALRGEIAVNLTGESSTTKSGKLVNTFDNVPDAPVSQFNLNVNGGKTGILAVTRTRKAKINLCAGRHIAESDMDGHNGRRHDTDIRMATPCSKRQVSKAKRAAAKRAAARR